MSIGGPHEVLPPHGSTAEQIIGTLREAEVAWRRAGAWPK